LESLNEVILGGAPMSPDVARRVVTVFRKFHPPATASYRLTPQETALLTLMVQGHHYKTAADAMGISMNTVSFHLKRSTKSCRFTRRPNRLRRPSANV
jgi:DNA-binding NarL/FixJ family response regulator